MVFFEPFSRVGLLLHLIASAVLLGSLTQAVLIQRHYLRHAFNRSTRERTYIRVACWTYAVTFVLGAIIYPTFRVRVRAEYFDTELPWATGIFEAKEHWAAIGLILALAVNYLRRRSEPADLRNLAAPYLTLTATWTLICWYQAFAGAYLTMLRSV